MARKTSEPEYIKLYIDEKRTGTEKRISPILIEFVKYMTCANSDSPYGGQLIFVNMFMKEQIAETLGLSVKRIEQAITDFVKNGIFDRVYTGTYQVNPYIFGKGNWEDINSVRAIFKKRRSVCYDEKATESRERQKT